MDALCRGCSLSNKRPRLRRVCVARDLLDKERMDTDGPALVCSFDSEDMPKIRRALIWDVLDHGVDDTRRQRREPKLLQISQVLDVSQSEDNFYRAQRDASEIPHITLTSGNVERRLVVRHPFVLILMNAQQGRWPWRCGHNHGIQLDSTFNTVRSRFSVFTIYASRMLRTIFRARGSLHQMNARKLFRIV